MNNLSDVLCDGDQTCIDEHATRLSKTNDSGYYGSSIGNGFCELDFNNSANFDGDDCCVDTCA
jgi:hypothetical protein